MASLAENNSRAIIQYVPPFNGITQIVSLQNQQNTRELMLAPTPISTHLAGAVPNDDAVIVVPKQLAGRKRRLITGRVIGYAPASFIIVPCKGEVNHFTIKLNKKGEEPSADPYGLNHKYYDLLHGWQAEMRVRRNGKVEPFYFHETKRSECRSTGDARRHVFKGFEKLKIEVNQETNAVTETFVGVRVKRTSKSAKSKVEKFLADAWSNLMNRDNKQKDEAGMSQNPSKKRKAESSNLEGESATKYQRSSEQPTIRCKLTPQEKYELEKFLADAWNNLMNSGKQNKDEIEPEQVDSNGTPSSSNLAKDPIDTPQLFPGGNTGSSANVDGRELIVQKEVYKGKEVAKAVNSEDNSGKGVVPMPPLFQEMVAQKEVDKESKEVEIVHGNVDENGGSEEVNQQKMKIFGHWIIKE